MNAHNPLSIHFNPPDQSMSSHFNQNIFLSFNRVANAKDQLIHTQCESSVMDKMECLQLELIVEFSKKKIRGREIKVRMVMILEGKCVI